MTRAEDHIAQWMTDEQLIKWIKGQYHNLQNPPQSSNAEVEWERAIPEDDGIPTQDDVTIPDTEERPEKRL